MINDVKDLKMKIHDKILILRRIENIVSGQRFKQLWEASDQNGKSTVTEFVDNNNHRMLIDWMLRHPSLSLAELSIRQLRHLASKKQIPYWSRMTKVELIRELMIYD